MVVVEEEAVVEAGVGEEEAAEAEERLTWGKKKSSRLKHTPRSCFPRRPFRAGVCWAKSHPALRSPRGMSWPCLALELQRTRDCSCAGCEAR